MHVPTLADVYAARPRVARLVRPTPLVVHPLLNAETGLDIRVKHENHNPTGAFKVRGGANLIASLPAEDRRGVVTATTGNHGQSIAFACRTEGVPCTIVVPIGNNPEKNAAMRAYGAELIEFGRDFDEARERTEHLQHERSLHYVHSANEPLLIAGVGTYALEIFEEQPDTDVILVPIGGGSGARIESAERRVTLRAFARDQRAEPLVHHPGLLANATQRLRARQQVVIENQCCSHAYEYA